MKWLLVRFAYWAGWADRSDALTQLYLVQHKPTLHRRVVLSAGTACSHWSSGPGNYTFDPNCWWCRWKARWKNVFSGYEEKKK